MLKNTGLELVDYYNCEEISRFIPKIDNYDSIIITGNLQYQIRTGSLLISAEEKELLWGCDEFNLPERKMILKKVCII